MIAPAVAAAPAAEVARTVLPNGLTVLSEHIPGVRSVALGVWVRAASVHEPRDRMGVSHLLEHMVFKGTERRSAHELALALEALGGSLDAYTAREHTSFQARVLDEHLPVAADVLHDLVFRPLLRDSDLTLERDVVLEEIGMVEDTPDDLCFELHNAQVWGTHPFGYSILGTRETVASLRRDDLLALHTRAYHPAQMVVAAAGNVPHARLLQVLGEAGWGDRPAGDPAPLEVPTVVAAEPGARHVAREGAQVHLVLGSPTVPHADPRRLPLTLAGTVLGGGMSSRLFQHVRETLGLAYSVFSFESFHGAAGMHGVYVGTAPDKAARALGAVREELDRLASEGLSDEDLARAKAQVKGQTTLGLESPGSRMYRAASTELLGEPYLPLDALLARIDAVTPAQVRAACAEFFAPARQSLLQLGP